MEIPAQLGALFTRGVTELMLVGSGNCFIDRGGALEKVPSPFQSDAELSSLLIELALESGSRLDLAKPMADFSISNFRFSAQLQSAVSLHPMVTIRRHPKTQITLEHLLATGFLTESQAQFLGKAVYGQKTILISGATSSGKTTLLSALVNQSGQRCAVIEQTPEIKVTAPSFSLLERPKNQEGVGLISQSELLTAALRMRPDRLVLGEVRGAEFIALLQAVNNGHPALATLHARSLAEVSNRLLLLGQLANIERDLVAQLAMGIDYVVQLENIEGRRISQIGRLQLDPFQAVSIEL
ncbi:MAG: Flp pilus assembly complex ATPase component TadA [Actinomycetota bacterium]